MKLKLRDAHIAVLPNKVGDRVTFHGTKGHCTYNYSLTVNDEDTLNKLHSLYGKTFNIWRENAESGDWHFTAIRS